MEQSRAELKHTAEIKSMDRSNSWKRNRDTRTPHGAKRRSERAADGTVTHATLRCDLGRQHRWREQQRHTHRSAVQRRTCCSTAAARRFLRSSLHPVVRRLADERTAVRAVWGAIESYGVDDQTIQRMHAEWPVCSAIGRAAISRSRSAAAAASPRDRTIVHSGALYSLLLLFSALAFSPDPHCSAPL